jgi:orotate phosphoribosyltransferase
MTAQPTQLQTPSGTVFVKQDLLLLQTMHEAGFVRHQKEPFRLKSGVMSQVYVFGREDLTDNPKLLRMVGEKICQVLTKRLRVSPHLQVCLIGIPTAGTPFAQAASMVSYSEGYPINRYHEDCGGDRGTLDLCFRIMKEVTKAHGAHGGWINGKPNEGQSYVLVDNVATNGASKPEAVAKLKQDGYFGGTDSPEKPPVFIWIDRQQGAIQNLAAAGFDQILVGYNLLDITYAYGELGLWPKSAVKAVETEIHEHQILIA